MINKILQPKQIRKANMWLVSIFTGDPNKGKAVQKMNWFGTKEEANKFYAENNIN